MILRRLFLWGARVSALCLAMAAVAVSSVAVADDGVAEPPAEEVKAVPETEAAVAEPGPKKGTRVFANTRTLFMVGQVLDPNDPSSYAYQAPIFEYLTVGATDVGVDGFSFYISGFGMLQPLNQLEGGWGTGDLLVGTLSYSTPNKMFSTTFGRQMVFESVGPIVLIDGASLKVRPGLNTEVSAFGGWVPDREFDHELDRMAFGARVAYNPWQWGRVGVGYSGQYDDGGLARSSLGVDFAFRYKSMVELAGHYIADLLTLGTQEGYVSLAAFPNRDWRVSADYRMVNPASWLTKTSIFSVFANAYEHHEVGAEVGYGGRGWFSAKLGGKLFYYGDGELGYVVRFRPELKFDRGYGARVGIEVSRLDGMSNGYTQARIYGAWEPVKGLFVTVDEDNYFYDEAVLGWQTWRREDPDGNTAYILNSPNGEKRSHIVGGTLGYEVFDGGQIQGDVRLTINPDFTQNWTGLIKFTHQFFKVAG